MAKGKFRSSDYVFAASPLASALGEALGVSPPMKRENRMEVTKPHKQGRKSAIKYRRPFVKKAA